MAVITLDKIIFRNNDSYLKMYKGSELIAEVEQGGGLDYLTFTAKSNNATIKFDSTNRPNFSVEYSTDGGSTWTNGNNVTVTLSNGSSVKYRGIMSSSRASQSKAFVLNGNFYMSGSIMSLINKDPNDTVIPYPETFYYFFYNCTQILNIDNFKLPATTLKAYCYQYMFYNCTGITSIPSDLLSAATTLTTQCYGSMFQGCTNLSLPNNFVLPATTLTSRCYYYMFYGCKGITSIPSTMLPATTLAEYCYQGMFGTCKIASIPDNLFSSVTTLANYSCQLMFSFNTTLTSLSTFSLPSISNISSYSGVYRQMFRGCSAITTLNSALLPSTTLGAECYGGMFMDCTGLTSLPSNLLPATTLASTCYNQMFQGCTGLTTLPTGLLPATSLPYGAYLTMFSCCTGLTSLPSDFELPATAVSNASVYNTMFSNCTSLETVPKGMIKATAGNANTVFSGMFSGCTSLTQAPDLKVTQLGYNGCKEMFKGCTSLVTPPSLRTINKLGDGAMSYMFDGCTSLTSVPSMNVNQFTGGTLNMAYMFRNCTSLVYIDPMIAYGSPIYAREGTFKSMFEGCTSLVGGTLWNGSVAPWNGSISTYGTFEDMFKGCTSLTYFNDSMTGAALRVTINSQAYLSKWCFRRMFYGCTSLQMAASLPNYSYSLSTSTNAGFADQMFYGCKNLKIISNGFARAYSNSNRTTYMNQWLSGVSSRGVVICHSPTTYDIPSVRGESSVPSEWNIQHNDNYWPLDRIRIKNKDNTRFVTFRTSECPKLNDMTNVLYWTDTGNEFTGKALPSPDTTTTPVSVNLKTWMSQHPTCLVAMGPPLASTNTNVKIFQWDANASTYETWPGQQATYLGLDPTTGGTVWYRDIETTFPAGQAMILNVNATPQSGNMEDIVTHYANDEIGFWDGEQQSTTTWISNDIDIYTTYYTDYVAGKDLYFWRRNSGYYYGVRYKLFEGVKGDLVVEGIFNPIINTNYSYNINYDLWNTSTNKIKSDVTQMFGTTNIYDASNAFLMYGYVYNADTNKLNRLCQGATNMVKAPTLVPNVLENNTIDYFVKDCSEVNDIAVLADTYGTQTDAYSGVAATGTFTKKTDTTIPDIPSGWTVNNV